MSATPAELDTSMEFEDIYARFGPTVYIRCQQILRDPAAAEDATQEVFLRIHQRLARIRGTREALAWLYRAATNHCLNELRNGRHRPMLVDAPPERMGPSLEQQLLDHNLVVRLVRWIPEALVLPAWLYHVDGLDQARVAEICGVSRRTVSYRLARFANEARQLLERPHNDSTA
jgi:RNA polymerase sigma-70 factor (ECF subfamily)